ncbi:MAG: T9SS type A sorting domain-containing protein [Candidatus Kapaibacterium sp.]
MRKWYWFGGLKMLAVLAMLVLCTSSSNAQQYKYLPTLSLVKTIAENGPNNPNDVTALDTVYVAEAGPGERRYFVMPVFMKNILDSITNPNTGLTGEPIYSFRFKVQYNGTLLHALGVQKRGVLPNDTNVAAKNFNLSWDVDADTSFRITTVGLGSPVGERIMITGSSSIPLPLPLKASAPPGANGQNDRDTVPLCYVLFEVIGQSQLGGGGIGNRDQIIIPGDSLRWNNYPATGRLQPSVPQFMIDRGFNPNPRAQAGIYPTPILPVTYPNNYGSAVIVITQRPSINLFPPGQVTQPDPTDPSVYELTSPLQTQFGNSNYIFRNLLIRNNVPGTFLRNVTVETDQPWLRIDLNSPIGAPGVSPGGTPGTPFERGVFIRDVPNSQINMNIVANPSLLPTSDGNGYPAPGRYIGYVTIRSSEALNSAVRLKVDLIVNRNPLESGLNPTQESTQPRGIQLLFRNSGPKPDTTYLTFGTGVGATDATVGDTLFGELQAPTPPVPGSFFARFFPPSQDTVQPPFNGLIDTRGVTPKPTNGESSIDIRNYKTNTTLVYCVRFGAGAPQNYPIVVEYDTRDFPNGSQLFVRDNINGRFFSTNLRQATSLGNTRRYFTIQDPNITGFCIEYTVPAVQQFPEINKGWNLVSLPVAPSDARSNVVFPNMISGKPIRFANNLYVADDTVRVGVGYFVKYGDIIDHTVAGTRVSEINEVKTPFAVRVYPGWNTVGGLSVMTTVDFTSGYGMSFGQYNGNIPQLSAEVYRYKTDSGYEQASLIIPGYGYWIKVDKDGYYRLSASPTALEPKATVRTQPYMALNQLVVSDNSQKAGKLYFGQLSSALNNSRYELPPVPAPDMFDARFDNNGFVSASKDVAVDRVVKIQGVNYPVVLSVAKADADYVLTDAATGEYLGSYKQGQFGTVTIHNPATKAVKITGVASSEMGLSSAFPNPASGKFDFSFSVPAEQKVSVVLYNTIGSEVARLFDGIATGKQTIEFTTEGIPAGVYYYKMQAGEFSQVRQVVIAK